MEPKTLVIAEIGENFIGQLDIALDLIDKSAAAGVDYVKFQSYRGDDFRDGDPEKEWFKKVTLSNNDHRRLMERCGKMGIRFLSSPFTVERARFLVEGLGMKEIKLASGVMLNVPILDYLNGAGLERLFLSTGMATIEEIDAALAHLPRVPEVWLLHCVTQYPCSDEDANLKAIQTLQQRFYQPVGYSDHTVGTEACLAATALGARVIEKHYTFSKSCNVGTDHEISVEPDELGAMVASIRRIEKMRGNGVKAPGENEKKIIDFVRSRF